MMRNERGTSLISILVAMVLLSVGVLALSRTAGEVVAGHTNSALRTTALSIARGYLEEIRSRDPQTLASESAVTVNESGQPDANGRFTRSVDVQVVETTLKQLTVIVDYPRSRRPIELLTLTFVPVF